MVLSIRKQNTVLQALVLQPGAGSPTLWPVPRQPMRVPYQLIPPNKCPVSPGRVVELSEPPPDECRAPASEWDIFVYAVAQSAWLPEAA